MTNSSPPVDRSYNNLTVYKHLVAGKTSTNLLQINTFLCEPVIVSANSEASFISTSCHSGNLVNLSFAVTMTNAVPIVSLTSIGSFDSTWAPNREITIPSLSMPGPQIILVSISKDGNISILPTSTPINGGDIYDVNITYLQS